MQCPWNQDYKKQVVSLKEVFHHQNARKGRLVCIYQHGEVLADQLRSIEVKIKDEDVYMVLFISLPPSFDNLVTSLDSMSTKDVDLQFIIVRLLHEVFKKKMKVRNFLHCLTKLIRQIKSFAFIIKNLDTL